MSIRKCIEKFQQYHQDPDYVYNSATDESGLSRYITIYKKNNSQTNESRKNIVDEKYALYRADQLQKILMFDKFTLDMVRQFNVHTTVYDDEKFKTTTFRTYKNMFDTESVDGPGIYYYRSIGPAFYEGLDDPKLQYSGVHCEWDVDGMLQFARSLIDGKIVM